MGAKVQEDPIRQQMLRDALKLLQSALELLDRAGAPAQIGAHLDLALHQLGAALAPKHDAITRIPHGSARN